MHTKANKHYDSIRAQTHKLTRTTAASMNTETHKRTWIQKHTSKQCLCEGIITLLRTYMCGNIVLVHTYVRLGRITLTYTYTNGCDHAHVHIYLCGHDWMIELFYTDTWGHDHNYEHVRESTITLTCKCMWWHDLAYVCIYMREWSCLCVHIREDVNV